MSKYSSGDASNRLNGRMKSLGGGKFNADPKRERGGKFVEVNIRDSRGERHGIAGTFTFGCVDKANGVPWFWVDGAPDAEQSGQRIAALFVRMAHHLCKQLETRVPGFTEMLFNMCADEAEAVARGEDRWTDE